MKKHDPRNTPVIVIGAGGTGRYIAQCVDRTKKFCCAGFLDDDIEKQSQLYNGLTVLGGTDTWRELEDDHLFINSLYGERDMQRYRSIIRRLSIPDDRWATIVAPDATIFSAVKIGRGSFVGPGTVVEPGAVIGSQCALLGNVYIAHDCVLNDYVCCANSVSISGDVFVGESAFVGANASIRQHLKIGADAIIGMGSVVVKSVGRGVTVAGNPAKPMKQPNTETKTAPRKPGKTP